MTKKTMIAAALCMALALNLAALDVYAEGYCKIKGKSHGFDFEDKFCKKAHFILEHKDELGLSDRQVKQIKDLKLRTKKYLIGKKAEIEMLGLDLKSAMWNDPLDPNAVNKLIDKKYDLKKEKASSLVAAYAELKGLLTKEQKEKMKELFKKCKKDKKHMMPYPMKGKN